MSWFFSSPYDDLVITATSENHPAGYSNIVEGLEIADVIKTGKYDHQSAIACLKKRLSNDNPNVQLLTLNLIDVCLKNSGLKFLKVIDTPNFIDPIFLLLRNPSTDRLVYKRLLTLIQSWSLSFTSTSRDLSYLPTIFDTIKYDYDFPKLNMDKSSAAAMFDTVTAPEWSDSEVCERCRTQFSTFNRKHHCRNCGKTFCGQCSSKSIALPHFGINEDSRVCDICYIKVRSGNPSSTKGREQSDIQRALALSLDDSSSNTRNTNGNYLEDQEDADLRAAINASLKEEELRKQKGSIGSNENNKAPDYAYNSNNITPAATSNGIYPSNQNFETLSISAYQPQQYNTNNQFQQQQSQSQFGNINSMAREVSNTTNNFVEEQSDNVLNATELENLKMFNELVFKTEQDVSNRGIGVLNYSKFTSMYQQISPLQSKLAYSLNDSNQKAQLYSNVYDRVLNVMNKYDYLLNIKQQQQQQTQQQQQQIQEQQIKYPYQQQQQQQPNFIPNSLIPLTTTISTSTTNSSNVYLPNQQQVPQSQPQLTQHVSQYHQIPQQVLQNLSQTVQPTNQPQYTSYINQQVPVQSQIQQQTEQYRPQSSQSSPIPQYTQFPPIQIHQGQPQQVQSPQTQSQQAQPQQVQPPQTQSQQAQPQQVQPPQTQSQQAQPQLVQPPQVQPQQAQSQPAPPQQVQPQQVQPPQAQPQQAQPQQAQHQQAQPQQAQPQQAQPQQAHQAQQVHHSQHQQVKQAQLPQKILQSQQQHVDNIQEQLQKAPSVPHNELNTNTLNKVHEVEALIEL